ncbi:SAWADEE domain containing protein [Quillaja saponaria]|uniref:SAWADEE domain containing protein n=1 Tax=Quillaja saponaria TaxID=32244 RepID=A0AAD7LLL9_QUISA|nr:SAWADEE domain containing protein [Quillaja saponaria]
MKNPHLFQLTRSDVGQEVSISPENLIAGYSSSEYNLEFRAVKDDAWYSVQVLLEGDRLRIKYQGFSDAHDNLFDTTSFGNLKELEEFQTRFRPASMQLQDDQCRKVVEGMTVCASFCFGPDELLFYDAVVDGPTVELDPKVTSFLKMTRERIENTSDSNSNSKGAAGLEVGFCRNESSSTRQKLGFFERLKKETRFAKRSESKTRPSEERRSEDLPLGGVESHFVIMLGNLDKALSPSTITEFLHRHTSVIPRVYVFPTLKQEIYTRGAIVLDCEKSIQKISEFLDNPNRIIISSTGRPLVIIEKLLGPDAIKASMGTLMPISKKRHCAGSDDLRVVFSGTQEYEIAKCLRDLFMEFTTHQNRLQQRLMIEEQDILQLAHTT